MDTWLLCLPEVVSEVWARQQQVAYESCVASVRHKKSITQRESGENKAKIIM